MIRSTGDVHAFVRSQGLSLASGAVAVAAVMLFAAPISAQAPAPPRSAASAEAKAIALLLEGSVPTAPGTYAVSGTALEPSKDLLPVIIQADALRGPEKTVQAVVALGARVTQAAVTRARIVARGGSKPAVVSDISGSSPAGEVRAVNRLTLWPGEYELQAAVAQPGPGGKVLATLVRARLVVPDLWGGGLAVSPLVLGDTAAAAPESAAGGPFTFGPTLLRPAAGDHFPQGGDLHVAFRVYNWTAPPKEKPDLQVEYVFYERTARRGHFFNKVKPQMLNAQTLGDGFDPASGVVNGGLSLPLLSFPFGEFQLTVRVKDNRTKLTTTQEARFVVVP
jgi:hypothetical protein